MQIRQRRPAGYTLIEVMIVVSAIGLLAAIAIPNWIAASDRSKQNVCTNNLRQIDAAKQQWALEYKKTAEAVPSAQDLSPYFKDGVFPVCPAGGVYTIGAVGDVPACSVASHVLPQ